MVWSLRVSSWTVWGPTTYWGQLALLWCEILAMQSFALLMELLCILLCLYGLHGGTAFLRDTSSVSTVPCGRERILNFWLLWKNLYFDLISPVKFMDLLQDVPVAHTPISWAELVDIGLIAPMDLILTLYGPIYRKILVQISQLQILKNVSWSHLMCSSWLKGCPTICPFARLVFTSLGCPKQVGCPCYCPPLPRQEMCCPTCPPKTPVCPVLGLISYQNILVATKLCRFTYKRIPGPS